MSVLVIGGGITGLVAARALARAGLPTRLVEADGRLGGKVQTETLDGFRVEHGPDSFLATRRHAVALVHELGLDDQLIGTRDPRIVYIRQGGRLLPMPEGLGLVLPTRLLPFVRTRLFSWPEKLRMALDLVAPRQLGPDDVAVGAYLRSRLGSALVDRLAGPLVGGVYGTPIDELSLDAVVPQLRTAEREHRSLLLAGLADGRRMREARAMGPRRAAPLGPFVSLRGGMSHLVDALATSASDAGADLRTGLRATTLERSGPGVRARFDDGSSERHDVALLAVPAPVAAALLTDELPIASRGLAAIPHGSTSLVSLAYDADLFRGELVGHGYLVPRSEGGLVAACTWSSEKWVDRAPQGSTLVRVFMRDDAATDLSDDLLIGAAREEIARHLPGDGAPAFARVTRYPSSMPRYSVGHLDRLALLGRLVAAWPAVELAGASYRGVGLGDCMAQGQVAAERVTLVLGDRAAA